MSWPRFLRDADGTIVLEEVDEETGTATFRVHGRRSLVAMRTADGVVFDGEAPDVLRVALAPPAFGRFVAASRWS
jgi:kynureninase